MQIKRRTLLHSLLFGSGYVGLRALATGLPVGILTRGPRALADTSTPTCATPDKAQFFILSTSQYGDPINTNCPGVSYTDPSVVHPDPGIAGMPAGIAPGQVTVGGQQYTAASVWSQLGPDVGYFHMMTNTPVHPKEPQVLQLNGATAPTEMLPSLLAKTLAPCLGTIQVQPISLGASTPSEALTFGGQNLPTIPPQALKATLTSAADPHNLRPLRDQTLQQLSDLFRSSATTAQQAYLDSLIASQTELRSINQSLLDTVAGITGNTVADQITAAIALVQMNVSPVIAIHIPFGGDNHTDIDLVAEATQTVSGVQSIASLMSQLQAAGLQDKVSFITLNVFGRTLGPGNLTPQNANGRQHNPDHQVSIAIGKPFKGGVWGGVMTTATDYGATSMVSTTGAAAPDGSGDIAPVDTLASFGKTVLAAVGADQGFIDSAITSGKVITGALT
ncbi:MAG TPA: hypothetical protein VLX92_25275 [Kofleriaceae bacterium]|nr:hypothetical protein [Kofleriaceae bacterium]